jgi:hypothetical protein
MKQKNETTNNKNETTKNNKNKTKNETTKNSFVNLYILYILYRQDYFQTQEKRKL